MSINLNDFIKEYKDKDQAPILQGLFGNASRDHNVLYKKCLPITDFHSACLKDILDICLLYTSDAADE